MHTKQSEHRDGEKDREGERDVMKELSVSIARRERETATESRVKDRKK